MWQMHAKMNLKNKIFEMGPPMFNFIPMPNFNQSVQLVSSLNQLYSTRVGDSLGWYKCTHCLSSELMSSDEKGDSCSIPGAEMLPAVPMGFQLKQAFGHFTAEHCYAVGL